MISKIGLRLVVVLGIIVLSLNAPGILALSVNAQAKTITVPDDYATIQEAINSASAGDRIMVRPGDYSGAIVDKAVEIKGKAGTRIVAGYNNGAIAFWVTRDGSGAAISHLTIIGDNENLLRGVRCDGDNVTISHLNIQRVRWAIYIVNGDRCTVTHNTILLTRSDGTPSQPYWSIGVGLAAHKLYDYDIKDNLVACNKILAEEYTLDNDGPCYAIFLYRFSTNDLGEVTRNKIVDNKALVDGPVDRALRIADFWASLHPSDPITVIENMVGFNDFRGSTADITGLPTSVLELNLISRNLGDNRGNDTHEEPPAYIFNPQMEEI